jgi:CheY-like chemotaxis protein
VANILIVDDERDVVTLVKFILTKEGHTVDEAYNGAQALEKLGVEPAKDAVELPDLVILDVMMPVMDGHTACRRINENARTRNIPLIVLTAKGQMRDLFEMASNVAAYLEKPFDPKKLREMVSSVLGN